MGMLYKRGEMWWIKYYVNGVPRRESTGTAKETEARRVLREREGRVVTGAAVLPRADRLRYEELANDLHRHYETTGDRSLRDVDVRLKPLAQFFTGRRIVSITGALAQEYVQGRQAAGLANGTINRELSVLGTMLRHGYANGKVLRLPVIRLLKEAAPRSGFFEEGDYLAVRGQLRPDLQAATAIEYTFGWRTQEVLSLERRQLDLPAGTLRLDPGATKNDDGRIVYLTPDLVALMAAQVERVQMLERDLKQIIPFLFPHLAGPHKGRRIRDFRKAWMSACLRAGLTGMLRHDFRRTAVRNLVNSGTPEKVCMQVTGHKSRSVFDRYHIVSPTDLQAATRRLVEHAAGTVTGTVSALTRDAHAVSA